jgi:glycine oxidase
VSGTDVVVVGGGLIGLSVGWRAAAAGLDVVVCDDDPGGGASHVAAGMLAPVTEVTYGEHDLLRLGIASARRWPVFADALGRAAGVDVRYRANGTLVVGVDTDDVRALDDLAGFQHELGLDVTRLRSREVREQEPLLAPRVRGGLLAAEDHRVDPRRVVAALRTALERAGGRLLPVRVARVETAGGRVTGVTCSDGTALAAGSVVLAAGVGSGAVAGVPEVDAPAVRPVKGEVLRLAPRVAGTPRLARTVRAVVAGRHVYLVPRDDGRLVVGATQEELGPDTTVTAGGVRRLLDDASAVVPLVDELELVEASAGLRPGSPDNLPLIGPTSLDGLLLATGHHRNGALLAPVTADATVAWLLGDEPDDVVAVAAPARRATTTPGAPGPTRRST